MSKIQEALGRLRGDEARIGESAVSAPSVADTANKKNTPYAGTIRKRYSLPERARAEDAPKVSINVNIAQLEEAGLLFLEAGADLLAQQFRRIKRPILNVAFGGAGAGADNSNVVMMSSALPKSGKTFCAYQLAISVARERDIGAIIVDADVLKPKTSRTFGLEGRVGLIDHLLDSSISLDDILVGTDHHDIILVPAGRQHEDATELLASNRMQQFVRDLSARFEGRVIIVDTPPLLLTSEAHVLADHMGQIVFVIEAGATPQEAVTSALKALNRDKPINAIVNKSRGGAGISYDKHGGYYGYGEIGGSDD